MRPLLLCVALLTTGCATSTPAPRRATGPMRMAPLGDGYFHTPVSRTRAGVGAIEVEPDRGQPSVMQVRQAALAAVGELKGTTRGIGSELSRLAARETGIGGANGVFERYVTYGANRLQWLNAALGSVTTLTDVAAKAGDADMELGILRMAGPRLQAAMSGALLLSAWLDFLGLADVVLQRFPAYGTERLFMDMDRVQKLMAPSLSALASQGPGQADAAASELPQLMGQLTREFGSIREGARTAMERSGQLIAAAQLMELLTLSSALKLSLPRLPPAAPATVGAGLVMGSGGVMMGSQLVVSAEWVERMRRLVQAGVISLPTVSAAVRIHGGQVMMAQAQGDLPRGVREALGDGPEVRAMQETSRAGAGMAEPPRHHVLPQEHREWFEKRGFTGAMSIDQFCVRLEAATHQAIHGGGDWRLGRLWPGEWNRMIMGVLRDAETGAGRMLTREAVLKLVAREMRRYKIPMNFTPGSGR